MSRTRVQQSQISGSLPGDLSDSYTSASALTIADNRDLVADLNDMRRQLNRIIGEGSWSAALAEEQDLSVIAGAMVVDASSNAEFQFDLSVKGNTTLGDAATDTITFTAKAASDLAMDSHKVSGLQQASVSGDALGWGQDASVSDLIVSGGDFTVDASGNVNAAGTLEVDGAATFNGNVTLGDAATDTITFTAKAATDLAMDSHKVSGLQQASVSGDALGWGQDASVSDLIVSGGDFTVDASGNVDMAGSLTVDGNVTLGDAATDTITFNAKAATDLAMDSHKVSGLAQATASGDALGWGQDAEVAKFDAGVSDLNSLYVANSSGLSGSLTVAGAADFNGGVTADHITIDGDAAGHLYFVDPTTGEIQDSDDLRFEAGALLVSGSMEVSNGLSVLAGGMTVAGDRLEVTGSFGLDGDAVLDGLLTVTGVADFDSKVYMASDLGVSGSLAVAVDISAVNATLSGDLSAVSGSFSADLDVDGDLSAKKVSIDGDVAQRLYIVDADGSIKDESKLTFDGSLLSIDGDLKVGGNDIKASDDSIAISLNGADVAVKGDLTVEGNEIKSTTGTVLELNGLDAIFKANVQVDGDLRVKGATTYIDTQNMRVEDAFIYLATGSAGTTDSGIVLHGGAGFDGVNTIDLVMGQDGGAGEFIFGKGNRAPDGDGVMDGIELVPAWMSGLKVGGVEGSLSGSFEAITTGSLLSSSADLLLGANGQTPISFIESGEYALFNAQFPGSSLVAAIVAAGGNFKQDSFLPGVKAANAAISFASVGTLRTAAIADDASKKVALDVYLNGVRLAYTEDYIVHSVTEIKLTMATVEDDRLLVAIHNADSV